MVKYKYKYKIRGMQSNQQELDDGCFNSLEVRSEYGKNILRVRDLTTYFSTKSAYKHSHCRSHCNKKSLSVA